MQLKWKGKGWFTTAAVVLLLITTLGCASTRVAAQPPLTPLQRAELTYYDASLGFKLIQQAAAVAAKNGQMTLDQARSFDNLQRAVNAADANFYPLLLAWKASGSPTAPAALDAQLTALLTAIANATAQVPASSSKGGK